MKSRGPTFGVLVFYSTVLTISLVIVLGSISPARWMNGNRVKLHAYHLTLLARQTDVTTPGTTDPCNLTFTFGEPGFSIQGLAYINQFTRRNQPGQPETHLWFAVDGVGPRLSRSHDTSAVRSLILIRDDNNSDLVEWPNPRQLVVSISPLQEGEDSVQSNPASVSNDLTAPAATIFNLTHTGFIDAVTARREYLNSRDAHIFSLLARILRPRVCDDLDSDSTHCYDTLLTIQRGGQQRDFFITLQHLRENRGVLRYRVRISFDSAGLPRSGKLSIITKDSGLDTPADLFVSHPRPSGELLKPKDHGFERLRWEPGSGAQHPRSTFVRFIPLLRDTTLPRK